MGRKWGLICSVAALLCLAGTASAQEKPDDSPVLLTADEVTYDEELGVVVARGHVEVSQQGRVLLADTITYNRRARTVAASGNVSLLETSGDVLFTDYVELTDDLAEGVIRNVGLLLADHTRLAAASGRRTRDGRTQLDKAVFSPCELCAEDPTRAPVWQIKAVKVTHNRETKTIEYRDAWMELFGVPVAYTPYFSHPDPTLKRKSGFLQPTVGYSDELGTFVHLPYYWAIGPDRDATIEPIFTERNPVLAGEYRQLFPNGRLELSGSATVADRERDDGELEKDVFRGHIIGDGEFDIDKHWRWGFQAQRSSDKSYMRLYEFGDPRTLTSRIFTEGFYGRSYALAESMAFQGQRFGDEAGETPIVLPNLFYEYLGEPDSNGGYFNFDANARGLTRTDGRDSRRISVRGGWTLPYISPIGEVITLDASVRADGYWVDRVDPDSDDVAPEGDTFDGFKGRLFPQARAEWRMPFIRQHETTQEILEPIAALIVAPNSGNPDKIPNDDSQSFEYDETHLFDLNRFPGSDRVDTGSRIDYGVKWSLFSGEYSSSVFIGQSYAFNEGNEFPEGSGLEDQLSDVVGRVELNPGPWLDLLYRFRFDAARGDIERNEAVLSAGVPIARLDLSYAQIDEAEGSVAEFGSREQVSATLNSQLSTHWSAAISGIRDLAENRNLAYGLAVTYQDECFGITASAQRRLWEDEEIGPDTRFMLTLNFKYLGDLAIPVGSMANSL